MSDFNPTHEFRGLELEQLEPIDWNYAEYRDEQGFCYRLPASEVTQIKPKPKPGEVWRYDDPSDPDDPYPLVLINKDSTQYSRAEVDTTTLILGSDLENMTKILNADGSPA